MREAPSNSKALEFRVLIIDPTSRKVLARSTALGYCLPRVSIPRWTRPAHQLCEAVHARWGLRVLMLDLFTGSDGASASAVAELLAPAMSEFYFTTVTLDQLLPLELSAFENTALTSVWEGAAAMPFSQIGWIDEAISWVERATGQRIYSKSNLKQFNVGGGFALVRFSMENGRPCWLKATGPPNDHERAMTVSLSRLFPSFMPRLISVKEEWNAWLTEGAGNPLSELLTEDALTSAASSFATFQTKTVDHIDTLVAAGAFDQRIAILKAHIDSVIGYLTAAMTRQHSTNVPPLSPQRLLEIADILHNACNYIEDVAIPDSLIHNDLNACNILYNRAGCVFIDWSEAAIGNPLLSCARLCKLNPKYQVNICSIYRRTWLEGRNAAVLDGAFALMPLLSIYACLYGRGDWIVDADPHSQFDSYARSLARHMDRAAQTPGLLEVLCH